MRHQRPRRLMTRFAERTRYPVMINTSFNIGGEPTMGSPERAWRCFMGTDMDVLVLESFLLLKDGRAGEAVSGPGALPGAVRAGFEDDADEVSGS